MGLLDQLINNKGNVSTVLSKQLAEEVLQGKRDILLEAIEYCSYELDSVKAKSVRAGAAKMVEKVAEKKPQWVAPHLTVLRPALDAEEPQTRWMAIRIFGLCAKDNPEEAAQVIGYARQFIEMKQGICLSGAAERYLAEVGALNAELASKSLDILLEAAETPQVNEMDWILEGLIGISPQLTAKQAALAMEVAVEQENATRKTTLKRVEKLKKRLKKVIGG